jgi:putative transposase
MARLPRLVMPGHPHVIIHRGHSAQAVFLDGADRSQYLASLRESARAARVAVHGYGLLPSETRLLVTPETDAGLAELMQSVGRRYVPAFNKKYVRTGTPWEGRFRSTVIEAGRHFASCLRFAEGWGEAGQRPAASGGPDDAAASSAAHHLGLRVDPLITAHPAFWAFGNTPFEREAAYRRYAEQKPPESEVATILLAALNGWVLGSADFSALVAQQTSRRPQPAPRGRPRKVTASVEAPASRDVTPI